VFHFDISVSSLEPLPTVLLSLGEKKMKHRKAGRNVLNFEVNNRKKYCFPRKQALITAALIWKILLFTAGRLACGKRQTEPIV